MNPKQILALIKEKEVRAVDLRFMDFIGLWQHISIPAGALTESDFEDGFGFDGSSIRGWQAVNESDMLLVPDPTSVFLDPFTQLATLNMICDIQDPITRESYSRDPRYIAKKAVGYLQRSRVADTVYFGPEAEFFIFDDVRYDQRENEGFFHIDSVEAQWNRGRAEGPNLGHKIRLKQGYAPCAPVDQTMDLRNEMMQTLIDIGLEVECQHHEVGTAGQAEIDLKFDELVTMADNVMKYKYVIKNVCLLYTSPSPRD